MGEKASSVNQDAASGKKSFRKRVWSWIIGVALALVLIWSVGACVLLGVTSQGTAGRLGLGGDAVAVVYLEGPIGMSSPTMGAGVQGSQVIDYIELAENNRRVKAIVVYINSPGGTVVPSDQMYQALHGASKPVVAVLGDVAASGGYYVACGADRILAHPASITGSIGVYGQLINAADLLDKLGVEGIIIRSGDSKAIGNWFEHPTEEQLAIQQGIVDELHALFIDAVAEGREMERSRVKELADGRPYTGQQALELGLIDALGDLPDGIDAAADLAEIKGEPDVIEYRQSPSLLDTWLGARQRESGDVALLEWLEARSVVPQARYIGR